MIGWNSGRKRPAARTHAANPSQAALRALVALGAAIAALWLMSGCAGNPWKEGKPDAHLGENCERVAEARGLRDSTPAGKRGRVINYVDPELCGRYVQRRGPYHVRTEPVALADAQGSSAGRGR